VHNVARTVAVATIHEEDFSLDELSIEELENLRGKVEVALVRKYQVSVPLLSWEFEPPDDRSYGLLKFEAQTLHGKLVFEGMIGSDGNLSESEVLLHTPETLANNDGPDDVSESFEGWPDALNDVTQDECKAYVLKALLEWQASYGEE